MKIKPEIKYYLIIIIISILVIYQSLNIKGLNKTIVEDLNNTKELKNSFHLTNELLINNIGLQFQSDGLYLDKNAKLITIDEDTIIISDILNKTPKVFYYYSELSCSVCFEEELRNLENASEKIGKENIILLVSFRKLRDITALIRIHQIDFKLYNLNFRPIGIPVEDYNVPFVFLADNTYKINHLFIPSKEINNLSDMYYDIIYNKYYNDTI